MFDRFVEIQRAWHEAQDAKWSLQQIVGDSEYGFAVTDGGDDTICQSSTETRAKLIARAPEDIQWLCAEIQRLKEELETATSSGEVVGKSRDGDITLAKFKIAKPKDGE